MPYVKKFCLQAKCYVLVIHKLEKQIMDAYSLKSFVKIDGDQIRVVIESDKHDNSLANNIIRTVQQNYDKDKYISVKFQV